MLRGQCFYPVKTPGSPRAKLQQLLLLGWLCHKHICRSLFFQLFTACVYHKHYCAATMPFTGDPSLLWEVLFSLVSAREGKGTKMLSDELQGFLPFPCLHGAGTLSSFLVPSGSLDDWFSKFQLNRMEQPCAASTEIKR